MHRNLINLILACGILVLVVGCYCRSGRDKDDPTTIGQSEDNDSSEFQQKTKAKNKDEGDFVVEHLTVTTPRYVEIDRQVKREKLLEKAADQLNRSLILPHDITLRTKDCSQINAFYDASDRSVTMCYELMEHFYNTFRSGGESDQKAYDKMFDAVRFVFLHEIGHALIDEYKLPPIAFPRSSI